MFSDLHFGSPLALWGLLALPLLAGLFFWAERQAAVRLARLIRTPRLRAQLTGANSAARRRTRHGLLLLALGALILALGAPQWGYETRETHRRGLDLLVLVDVSKSMLATDLPPTRLARAKLAVQDFVTQLQGDRVGLIAFAGTAFLQAPLTVDYDAVLNSVNELDTDTIPRGGTDLGGAIDLAVDAFGKAEAGNRALLLLSDGEPTVEGEAAAGLLAARRAADAGVRIYTLGFGTPEGSLIPLGPGGNFVRDSDGKIVRTKLDEGTLKEIARAGNGFYTRFNGAGAIQTVIQQGLGHLKAGDIDTRQARRPIERYQWPLGVGLALLAAGAFLGERRRSVAALSPGPRAVPTGSRAPAAATVAAGVLASLLLQVPAGRAAEKPSASPDPLELYKGGHYDEAYKAFQSLAEKNPQQESLEFNAGASAYKGQQYDEALDAFGKAMTSNNVDLQAKANYNFANTLFRRGAVKPDRDAKIADWKNALEHYDAALNALKQHGGPQANPRLNTDTAFNRDYVKKQLDALMKEPPQDQKDQKKPPDQKNDDKQSSKGQSQPKPDQGKSGQNPSSNSGPSGKGSQGDKPDQNQSGQGEQEAPPNPGQDEQKQGGNPPPSPSPDDKEQKGSGDDGQDQAASQGKQDMPPDPGETKPREHGDFKAQAGNQGGQATPQPGEGPEGQPTKPPPGGDKEGGQPTPQPGEEKEGTEGKDEPGKMNAAQARALLDSLKGEDTHPTSGGDQKRQHSDDDPPLKDW